MASVELPIVSTRSTKAPRNFAGSIDERNSQNSRFMVPLCGEQERAGGLCNGFDAVEQARSGSFAAACSLRLSRASQPNYWVKATCRCIQYFSVESPSVGRRVALCSSRVPKGAEPQN